jgi:hypothetical protein
MPISIGVGADIRRTPCRPHDPNVSPLSSYRIDHKESVRLCVNAGDYLLARPFPASLRVAELRDVFMGARWIGFCDACRLDDRADPITEIIATKVIEVFQSGERDPTEICNRTIKELGIPILERGD